MKFITLSFSHTFTGDEESTKYVTVNTEHILSIIDYTNGTKVHFIDGTVYNVNENKNSILQQIEMV